VMRYWISMYRQFFTKDMTIRITGDNGQVGFPIIQKDDLLGEYDFRAVVNPAIAGQNDIKKKQDMDLFQLLVTLPFIDPEKLTSKVLYDWNWNLESVRKTEQEQPVGPDGQPMDPAMAEEGQGLEQMPMGEQNVLPRGSQIPPEIAAEVMRMLGGGMEQGSQFAGQGPSAVSEMARPVNLLQKENQAPPTPRGVKAPSKTTNTRGLNRKVGGKVDTNIPLKNTSSPESSLMNRALNIQR